MFLAAANRSKAYGGKFWAILGGTAQDRSTRNRKVSGNAPHRLFERVWQVALAQEGGLLALQVIGKQDSNARRLLAGVYARVSTINAGQDPAMQTRELTEYCQRRGWEIFDCYVDNGVSGRKDSRPQLNRLMRDAHARRFDVVICWRFDRFSRSVSHLCRALETFNALDIQFVSLCEQVDTSTPTGKLVFTILGAVAEGERNLIAERVRAGLRNARAKGKRLGRPTKAVDLARINALRATGHSWRTIASMMKLSVGTVHSAARSQHANARCA
jgi:DNA invertase Pin-like site-specific DNA recombinase